MKRTRPYGQSQSRLNDPLSYGTLTLAIIGVGILGLVLTYATRAASHVASAEAESGAVTGNAGPGATAGASGNASVKFGAGGSGGPTGSDGPVDASECADTASQKLGWGEPQYQSHFNTPVLDPRWHPYGPEPGHAGNGTRTPAAFTVANGNVTIDGKSDGSTGAMKFFPGQKYGRWEGCLKVGTNGNGFNALFLHWPDAEDFPVGGEIDWVEIFSDRNEVNWFLHYGPDNDQIHGSVDRDSTQWHSWAMEWTPGKMTAWVDGEEWYSTTDTSKFPPRPMDWCIQLDNFGRGGTSSMVVDWTKQWAIPESQPSTLGLKPGDPATGQPEDYPERAPRPMSIEDMLP